MLMSKSLFNAFTTELNDGKLWAGRELPSLHCCILRFPSFTQSKRIALLGNMPGVMMFIDTQLETLDCSMNASMQIDVAIDKLYYNVVSYVFWGKLGRRDCEVCIQSSIKTAMSISDSGTAEIHKSVDEDSKLSHSMPSISHRFPT